MPNLAKHLTETSVHYRDKPFILRSAGPSHYYVDLREGLSPGLILRRATRLMVRRAGIEVVHSAPEQPPHDAQDPPMVAAGIGIAGRALAISHMVMYPDTFAMAIGNDNQADLDPFNGYGFHGASLENRPVLVVDEIATSGDSLVTAVHMVRKDGGKVAQASVLVDRSGGLAAERLGELGVVLSAVFQFDETDGVIKTYDF